MEHNTEDLDKRRLRNCCVCRKSLRKIYVLILLISLLIFAILGSLIAAHFSQRNEIYELRRASAKAIAECRQDVALIKEKLQQDRKNKTSITRNIFGKSSTTVKQSKVPKNITRREPNSRVPIISRQAKLNFTELRKEIREVIERDMFPKVHVNLLGKNSDKNLLNQNIPQTGMYTIRWDYSVLRRCPRSRESNIIEQCRVTRLTDKHIKDPRKRKVDIVVQGVSISAIKVKVAGIYFVYCQLTLSVDDSKDSKNIAHNISKVTMLASRELRRRKTEHIELISQTPVLTNQGNERLITISMFTQAYLYRDSEVRVTISFRNRAAIPYDRMEVNLYNSNKRSPMFNVFGMYLLRKTDDQP